MRKYIYIYIYIYAHFFFLFEELLSPLSGVKYRISQMPLYQRDTSNSQLFLYIVLGVIVFALYPKY